MGSAVAGKGLGKGLPFAVEEPRGACRKAGKAQRGGLGAKPRGGRVQGRRLTTCW